MHQRTYMHLRARDPLLPKASLRLQGVIVRQSGGTFHLANDRVKRAVGVLRRAEIARRVVWLGEAF